MGHYIKNIFENKQNEKVHNKLIRYSKGFFEGPKIKIRKQKDNIKIKSSFHIVDELLELVVKYNTENIVLIKGVIIYNEDLEKKFEELGLKYVKVTKSRGIHKYELNHEVDIKKFFEVFNNYNPLVSFTTKDVKITTKKSFPKPNKEISDSFCYIQLPISAEKEVYESFCFDIKDEYPKFVDISHDIIVEEVIFPKTDLEDFKEIRRLAKRKGKIKRYVKYDKKTLESEATFEA